MSADHLKDYKTLIDLYIDGEIDDDGFAQLQEGLRSDEHCRDLYLKAIRMDTMLREVSVEDAPAYARKGHPKQIRWQRMMWVSALVAACVIFAASIIALQMPKSDAVIVATNAAIWSAGKLEVGQKLKSGEMLELRSGSVEVHYQTGAVMKLSGPARFEITSANSGHLYYGEAYTRADTPESHGFSISTRSGTFIDQGTEFLTTATKDGFSQMHVTSGAVDVEVEGFERQRYEKGSGLGIEPGKKPIIIRIEPGKDDPGFSFPTISPPSPSDYADQSKGNVSIDLISHSQAGREKSASRLSGGAATLIDGKGQSGPDKAEESLFFSNNATGNIIFDMGEDLPIARISTYSWHLKNTNKNRPVRAVQRYTLWGVTGSLPESEPSHGDDAGWTRIARVDTDKFFNVDRQRDRPAQQACSISSSGTSIGTYRYLLFQLHPTTTSVDSPKRHTYFGEIDIFTAENP